MKTLYHGTSSVNLNAIKAIGLVPGHAKGGDAWAEDHHMALVAEAKKREPSVFVTDDPDDAKDFARYAAQEMGGDPIVVTMHVPEHVFATFVVDELFALDSNTPHAWRAHNIDAACVGKVEHVGSDPMVELLSALLARRLSTRTLVEALNHGR